MAYDFPASPTENQEFTPAGAGHTYIYKNPRWMVKQTSGSGGGGGIEEAPIDGKQYGRVGATPAWTEIIANPTWTTLSGKPLTFPPSTHTHPQSEVTSLTTDLAARVLKAGDVMTGNLLAPTMKVGAAGASMDFGGFSGVPISTLVGGSTTGGLIESQPSAHLVFGIRDNDAGDSVSIISYNATGAYSKLIAAFKANGLVNFPGDVTGVTQTAGDNTTKFATTAFVKNALDTGDALKVNKAGDTMTGGLTVQAPIYSLPTTGSAYLIAKSPDTHAGLVVDKGIVGAYAYIIGRSQGKERWRLFLGNAAAEAGSNAGSGFQLQAYNDAGDTVTFSPIVINRSDGIVAMAVGATTVTKTTADNTTAVATTAFVQANMALKAPLAHTHAQADVTNLITDLAAKLPLAGGTLTGTLNLVPPTGTALLNLAATAGSSVIYLNKANDTSSSYISGQTGGKHRWIMFLNYPTPEPLTGNSGGDFVLTRYNDAGSAGIDSPLRINRADGIVQMPLGATTLTQATADNDTSVATTAFVQANMALKANLASPVFSGVPTVPTAAAGTNTLQIASTAFVTGAITTFDTANDAALALKANLASPALTGAPTAPTPAVDSNSTAIATTAFVTYAMPIGAVVAFARPSIPTGWIKCNGVAVSRTTYAALYAVIGTYFGAGDGSTTFNLPDLRGEFVRGWDDARAVDASRVFGSAQAGGVMNHVHVIDLAATGTQSANHTHAVSGSSGNASVDHTHTFSDTSSSTSTSAAHAHTLVSTTAASAGAHTHTVPGTILGGTNGTPHYGFDTVGLGTSATDEQTLSAGAHTHTVSGSTDSEAGHSHTVAVSGTTGGQSVTHSHAISFTSGSNSVSHTHTVDGNTNNNTSGIAENRPRNVALMYCIKYN